MGNKDSYKLGKIWTVIIYLATNHYNNCLKSQR